MTQNPPRAPGARRALSHVGGEVTVEGDREAGERLAAAVSVPSSAESEELARAHVHGFHSYPARMHPLTARRLVEALSRPGDVVLDPFCGSGTVLVEARLAGRDAVGVDANPLAVRLARLKVTPTTPEQRAAWIAAAREVAAFADARRKARAGPTHRYGHADVALFAPHVLLEMDGLRAGLDRVEDAGARAALELVFSAILTKVSRREGDSAEREVEKRIAAGYPARLLIKKTEELAARLEEVAPSLAAGPSATVFEGDARLLDGVRDASIALAVTSPPYPGNYDYLAHHAARLRWLRLPPDRFDRAEVGARRRLDPLGPAEGAARWRDELGAVLRAVRRALRAGGSAGLLLAGSRGGGAPPPRSPRPGRGRGPLARRARRRAPRVAARAPRRRLGGPPPRGQRGGGRARVRGRPRARRRAGRGARAPCGRLPGAAALPREHGAGLRAASTRRARDPPGGRASLTAAAGPDPAPRRPPPLRPAGASLTASAAPRLAPRRVPDRPSTSWEFSRDWTIHRASLPEETTRWSSARLRSLWASAR